jgi:hypothetical protein
MSRFYTHHGEEQARLSRDTPILVDNDNDNEIRWTERVISLVTFKSSTTYLKTLNQIWTDHFVYAMDWNPFMAQCIQGWRTTFRSVREFITLVKNISDSYATGALNSRAPCLAPASPRLTRAFGHLGGSTFRKHRHLRSSPLSS